MITTRFTWTGEQKASVVPGASVVVTGSANHESGRYTIASAGARFVFACSTPGGPAFAVPWDRCDPSTLNLPPDPRQLGLFGSKP